MLRNYFTSRNHSVPELEHELRKERRFAFIAGGLLVLAFVGYFFFFQTPVGFEPETVVTVSSGESLTAIASSLKTQKVLSSPFWFTALVVAEGGEHSIQAGDYIFHKPTSLFSITRRFVKGDLQIVPVKVTFPEGLTSYDMAKILSGTFSTFNSVDFLQLTKAKEGYLFPDTYLIFADSKASTTVTQMEDNFYSKINPLLPAIATSTHSLNDIITMASILEGEGKTPADRKIISGILWKRIRDGIKLQVDSPFRYIDGKTTADLTVSDLKINSPYNTYLYTGLPPAPISNPGLEAIVAALYPTTTPYYYFLTDTAGVMHYAVTGAEHEANVKKYLR
jgi:UPF0755 protein